MKRRHTLVTPSLLDIPPPSKVKGGPYRELSKQLFVTHDLGPALPKDTLTAIEYHCHVCVRLSYSTKKHELKIIDCIEFVIYFQGLSCQGDTAGTENAWRTL